MSEWNANCWSSAARLLQWWSISRGCNDAMSASSSSKNYIVLSVHASLLDTDTSAVARITRLADAKLQLEQRAHWWRVREWQ